MKPYYENENGKLYHGDCLEIMPDLEYVDFILTSPPYKIGKNYNEFICYEESILKMSNVLKRDGVLAWQTGNMIDNGFIKPIDILTYEIFVKFGFSMLNRIVWRFGHGLHCKNRFSHRYEVVSLYSRSSKYIFNLDDVRVPQKYPNKKHYKGPNKGKLSGNPKGKNPEDVWDIPNVKNNHPEKTAHPCQFPLSLCDRLILSFTNKGDVVMDPFGGSGTTAISAQKNKRKYVLIEEKEKFCEIAAKRIEAENKQLKLF